jgi:EAL domain-containing protein (putative c-di-GMP-specific phosphodiesterase class I)
MQLKRGQQLYEKTGYTCSINVDNSIFTEDRLKSRLLEGCAKFDYPKILEFTELRPMPPADEINQVFLELKNHGVSIALDDFGTGFNGMSIFANYDFDIIKIDNSMITGLESRPQKKQILQHIKNLLDALDKQHVVEGVETQERLDNLVEIGYEVFQGYFFHRPQPLGDFT